MALMLDIRVIIYFGEGKDLERAKGEGLVEGADDSADGGAGGEDVIDEEEGGMGGGWRGLCGC